MYDANTPLVEALATFTVEVTSDRIPAKAIDYAQRAIVDTVAVSVAGLGEDPYRILAETVAAGGGRGGTATVWPSGAAAPPAEAALLNGTAGHSLDYDDMSESIHGHPSVVLVPALLAAAERSGARGKDILDAFAVGFEVQSAVGAAMQLRRHFAAGWHSTSSIAGIGAAAAAARLLGGSVDQVSRAIAIAVSMAGGSRENFGTMTKPLHAGLAARDAVIAAELAMRGMTAAVTALEGPQGYFTMFYGQDPDLDMVRRVESDPWSILKSGISIKQYPCCYNTARAAQAALVLAGEPGFHADQVADIRITLEPGGLDPLVDSRPETGLQGKFSGEFVVASALLDGRLGFDTFTDASVRRGGVRKLVASSDIAESATPPEGPSSWDEGYAVVQIAFDDGKELTARVDDPPGHWRNPLTDAQLRSKVADCFDHARIEAEPSALIQEVSDLGDLGEFRGLRCLGPRPERVAYVI